MHLPRDNQSNNHERWARRNHTGLQPIGVCIDHAVTRWHSSEPNHSFYILRIPISLVTKTAHDSVDLAFQGDTFSFANLCWHRPVSYPVYIPTSSRYWMLSCSSVFSYFHWDLIALLTFILLVGFETGSSLPLEQQSYYVWVVFLWIPRKKLLQIWAGPKLNLTHKREINQVKGIGVYC